MRGYFSPFALSEFFPLCHMPSHGSELQSIPSSLLPIGLQSESPTNCQHYPSHPVLPTQNLPPQRSVSRMGVYQLEFSRETEPKGDVYIYMSISSILRNSLTLIQRQETPKFAGVGVRPKIQGRAYVAIQVQRLLAEFSLVQGRSVFCPIQAFS